MQNDFFNDVQQDGWIRGCRDLGENCHLQIFPDFLDTCLADALLETLKDKIVWQQNEISIAGRQVKIPRLNAWYGDKHANYRYSGFNLPLQPWIEELSLIKQRIESLTDYCFNSVLANLYRDGQDSVAWHADNEPQLGINPIIASVSLGQTRRFHLKHKHNKKQNRLDIDLAHNTLLVMSGELQQHWIHQIPKSNKPLHSRINLTYRWIHTDLTE